VLLVIPDDVGAERPVVCRRYQLDVDLTPSILRPRFSSITFPESKEGRAGAEFVIALNLRNEFSILERLIRHDLARLPLLSS
jgi:hypothetical protein